MSHSPDDSGPASGPPSALQQCSRCKGYFTFDTETKQPSIPCKFHPGHFISFGGRTGATLTWGGPPPIWNCCGDSRRDSSGCKTLSYHVQDESFMDATIEYTLADRDAAVKDLLGDDWPPNQAKAEETAKAASDKGKKPLSKDWVEVRVTRDDTVAKLSIRYGCDTVMFRAINRLPSDMMLMSRNTVLVPPHDPEAKPPPPPMTEQEIRDKKVRGLMRIAYIPVEEARYYLDEAGGDMDKALAFMQEDNNWEMGHPRGNMLTDCCK